VRVHVCVCVRACVHVFVHACVRVRARAHVHVRMRVCVCACIGGGRKLGRLVVKSVSQTVQAEGCGAPEAARSALPLPSEPSRLLPSKALWVG